MPNRKNAILQQRKDEKRKLRNSACRAELKTIRKKFEKILSEGVKEKVNEEYKNLTSLIDKSVKKGIIPNGRAARLKSRYALKLNHLQ